jgi:predicted transcriptional regulator
VSQLPVVDDDKHLLGLVSEVSLLKYLLNTPGNESTNERIGDLDVVDRTVATVTPDTPLEAVMSMFTTSPVVVVVESTDQDDKRVPIGILTKIDLLSYLTAQV